VCAGKILPLTGAKNKNNNNNNYNGKKIIENCETMGATGGLPRRSPILVQFLLEHA
jgi:hypothetical protein